MIKNTLLKYFFLLAIILFINSCTGFNKPKQIEIYLVQTTDVHGSIFPYDFIRDKQVDNSLAQVYSFVEKYRNDSGSELILLDNGDILQGQPPVYYSNYEEVNLPHICSKVMNYMKYDVASIGNHDIEAGHAVYDKLVSEFDFPWLAANAVLKGTDTPYFRPYTVIRRRGVKVAVLGLITPGIPKWLPENLWKGMEFTDMVKAAKYWVPLIIEKEKPDILVGLFHAGHDYTYGGEEASTLRNGNASLLVAEQVPGFDVIFIGHDHDEFKQLVTCVDGSKVLVLDPGSHARNVSLAQIMLNWDKEKKEYKKMVKGSLIPMDNIKPDEQFMKDFEPDFENFKEYVSKKAGRFEKSISSVASLFGDSPFMDLIHKVQLQVSGA
ncbi:MAG: bifunctional metallophosphatase/5'-nucleotidase, partial [Bacteroidetes bacterium]